MNRFLKFAMLLALTLGLVAQEQGRPEPVEESRDVRLPNGRLQREEILKSEYQKAIQDSDTLAKLAESLRAELHKRNAHVLSISTLKETQEIEKLARRIRSRLKQQ